MRKSWYTLKEPGLRIRGERVFKMTVGERIRQRRQECGLSVDELAERLGKNRATIYRYESNDIENMPTSVLEPLAQVLLTTPAYLMGWEDNASLSPIPLKKGGKEMILRELRKKQGLTMKQLGEIIGASESTVSLYENGRREPSHETLLKLAEYFGVSVDYILRGEASEAEFLHPAQPRPHGVRIPVLGDVAAGVPIEAVTDILDYEEIEESLAHTGQFFGLRIKGASMEPRMKDGDVVIVRQQETADTGDTVVVLVNGDSATVKKIKYAPNGITLLPTNPMHDPLFYTVAEVESLPVRVIGRVVELRAKF